jgi:hypothetical protein
VDTRTGSFINASPVLYDGMVFVGFSGDEYADASRGGFAIVDQASGALLAHTYTIPDAEFDQGYWGGSIWSTGVVDTDTGYLYVGSGNPADPQKESRNTDAILKVDMNRSRGTFGTIVDVYKGTVEQYYPGLNHQPACDTEPDIDYGDAWSATCVQFDSDFGASPNLFHDATGNLVVGELQKSGVYHAVFADRMEQAWTAVIGTPCFACNAASSANDGTNVYAASVEPGQLVSLTDATGAYRWVAPLADVFQYQSVSLANGLAFVTDLYGTLSVVDTATGAVVAKKSLSADTNGDSTSGVGSGGVAIARHTVYVSAGGDVIAYR